VPGDLDATFGTGGKVTTSIGSGLSMTVQSDGIIDTATTLKVRDNVQVGTQPTRFLRVKVTASVRGSGVPIRGVAFSPDGKRIVSGSFDQTARVWEAANGHELFTLPGLSAPVVSVAFSSEGQRIATAGDDQTARVWDASNRHELLTVKKHGFRVSSVSFSPDGQRLVTGGGSLTFQPDGEIITIGDGDKTARIWDLASDTEQLTLKGHTKAITSVAFSLDGRRIVTGSMDQTAKVWDAASGK